MLRDSLKELKTVLLPPVKPVATGSSEDWLSVEARLGFRLPEDYTAFISTYGYGVIDGFVWVFSPFADTRSNLEARLAEHQAAHVVAVEYQDEPEGLVPWASNDYRGVCCWETDKSDPDDWTVYTGLDDDVHRFPENMTTFLWKTLTGQHLSTVFGGPTYRFKLPTLYEAFESHA